MMPRAMVGKDGLKSKRARASVNKLLELSRDQSQESRVDEKTNNSQNFVTYQTMNSAQQEKEYPSPETPELLTGREGLAVPFEN